MNDRRASFPLTAPKSSTGSTRSRVSGFWTSGAATGRSASPSPLAAQPVVGIDASPEMAVAARERGLDASFGNGESLHFSSEFDAVFSNAALHWMRRPNVVIAGVR